MPKCPKCETDIDYLNYYAYELTKACVSIVNVKTVQGIINEELDYYHWDSLGTTKGEVDFECPECSEVLFHTEEEAKEFLKQQKQTPQLEE